MALITPRRFKCTFCNSVRAISGAIKRHPTCSTCAAALVEIDKDGNPIVIGLERAPAIERVGIFMTEAQRERARVLILSAIGEEA
jgi:uncharacterized protein (DUF983 family)